MKKIQKYVVGIALALTVLIPQIVVAQTKSTTTPKTTTTTAAQNAQCEFLRNQITNAGGGNILKDLPAYCTTGSVYKKFIDFAFYAIGIVAVISVIYGGYLYMTSAGNETQTKKGRSVLIWAILGLVVVLLAAVIVNVVFNTLVENRVV